MAKLTPHNVDRLAKAMMQRHVVSYERALEMLRDLRLHLVCDESIRASCALQAAVVTAINTGKRAFRGGISVAMPESVRSLIPWPGCDTLNQIASDLGAVRAPSDFAASAALAFGTAVTKNEGLRVVCDGWRAGLSPIRHHQCFDAGADFALGGVFAGGFGVARSFFSAAAISYRDVMEPIGFSLWRPDLSWLSPEAIGPDLIRLPARLWLLGLGHLGQAYAWTLGLLPPSEGAATIVLQDFDVVEEGNWSAGLLCEPRTIGKLKTRVCADWFELRGFDTRLIERPFDESTRRAANEPRIALCGFDNAESRRPLEDAGFDLVVECGLGASLDRFDRMVLHTFPDASRTPRQMWSESRVEDVGVDPNLFGEADGECGIVMEEIAGKAISSSFTGACASALVVGEIMRAIHGGKRCEFLGLHLRDLAVPRSPFRNEQYQLRVAKNGLLKRGLNLCTPDSR